MAVPANRLGRLEQVLDLGEVRVRVAVVHERVEELHRPPDAHPPLVQREVVALLGADEVARLAGVVLAVELADAGAGELVVVAELLLRLLRRRRRGVAGLHEVVPVVQVGERLRVGHVTILTRGGRS